jgi:Raf kinase inhibitor-like YbhB/YbcL family protein
MKWMLITAAAASALWLQVQVGAQGGEENVAMSLRSPAIEAGSGIAKKYTCDGRDVSPPLRWDDTPAGTGSYALICDDPDAPMGTWVHWVIYNIPGTVSQLPEAVPAQEELKDGTLQGKNDFGRIGYGGPCPPRGKPHRYFFKLYALDAMLSLPAGATKSALLKAMEGHILAEAQFYGTYGRS